MNALGASILSVLVCVVLFAPARWALMGMMAGMIYLTQAQQVQVGEFNIFAMRFLELAGFIRVIARRELSFANLTGIDRALLLLYCYTIVVFLIRRTDEGSAFTIGLGIDAFLCYFTFRGLVKDVEDFRWFLRGFVILLVPYVVLVLLESHTSQNSFAAIGGKLVVGDEWFRGGRIRCWGTFRHPSLLGTLGGSFLALYMGLWAIPKSRKIASLGIILCLAIVWAANSGGPVSCVAVGLIGWLLWGMRARMYTVRRWLVVIILLFAVFMKAPIWYVLAKFSDLTGGDGWHRSYLMDVAFQNVSKWWLAGLPILETADWFPYTNNVTGGADITNQFLVFGLIGGLGAIILSIALLKRTFSRLGKAMAILRSKGQATRHDEFLYWGLSVTLAVHIFNWLGISYFDQTYVIWFLHLAIVTNLAEGIIRPEAESGTVASDSHALPLLSRVPPSMNAQ